MKRIWKRILGITLAVLVCAALLTLCVLDCVAKGCTLGAAILTVLIATVLALAMAGLIYLTVWLLC